MVKKMSNNTQNSIIQKNISLNSYFGAISRYWKLLLSIFVAFLLVFNFYYFYLSTPLYKSTAKLYIINKASDFNQLTTSDLSISTYLTRDFTEILQDEVVLSEVAEELSNKYTIAKIKRFLNVSTAENTRIIEIVVTSPNANDSKQIADSICRISQDKLVEIMGLDRVKIIRDGNLPSNPSSPNFKIDFLNSISYSVILTLALAFIILISDNKLSSCDDVEELLELNILTTIPYTSHKAYK